MPDTYGIVQDKETGDKGLIDSELREQFNKKSDDIMSLLSGSSVTQSISILDYVKSILPHHSNVLFPENKVLPRVS